MSENMQQPPKRKSNKRLLILSALAVIGMFGFCFAMVPLYNVFCNVTGLNGKTSNIAYAAPSADQIDKSRTITVLFVATRNQNLPWQFEPNIHTIKVHPGENAHLSFFAENDSGHRMTVQAIPSVSPGEAARYLKKTECFCFTQQTFDKDEKRDMPLIFHLEKDLPKNISTVTLSYTMFDATPFVKKGASHGK